MYKIWSSSFVFFELGNFRNFAVLSRTPVVDLASPAAYLPPSTHPGPGRRWSVGGTECPPSIFDELYEYLFVRTFKGIGIFFWKNIDLKTIDRFGPDGISNLIKKLSIRAVKFQSGYIYQYAFIMLLGFSALLTYLIII